MIQRKPDTGALSGKRRMSSSRNMKIRNQKPETRNQKPETRNQKKPETRNQKPENAVLISDFWFLVYLSAFSTFNLMLTKSYGNMRPETKTRKTKMSLWFLVSGFWFLVSGLPLV